MIEKIRKDWHCYFLDIAKLVATRSTCLRKQVGAVIVKNKHILSTGYNGAPSGVEHCVNVGCIREKLNIPHGQRYELCRACHGEENAIIQAAKYGVSIEGADLYLTHRPCINCTKMIINSGIKRVIYEINDLPEDKLQEDLIKESRIKFYQTNSNSESKDDYN